MDDAISAAWAAADAERAFAKAVRARRRASLLRRVLRRCAECAKLGVFDAESSRAAHGARDIPLDAIAGAWNRTARPTSTASSGRPPGHGADG